MMKIKKQQAQKKFKFQDCKSCLEAAQIENKTNHLEKKTKLTQIKTK